MFAACADPSSLEGLTWLACYLTTGKHIDFYWSFLTVLVLLAITAPIALAFGFGGAMAARSPVPAAALLGKGYTAMVRGVPDIVFFLFFVIALDQGIEWLTPPDASAPTGPSRSARGWSSGSAPRPRCRLGDSPQIWHQALWLRAGGLHLCHRLRRLCGQRAVRRDAGRAARAA